MKKRPLRTKVIAGAVVAAALVGGGAAVAADQLGSNQEQQAIIDDAAERLGVEPTELTEALQDAYKARIDAAIEAGKLTDERGEALKERIENGELPLLGFHHGHPGHPGMLHGKLDAAATYLGLTEAELREELESGKTLAEIATDEGKSVAGLTQALVDAAEEGIAAAVEAGRLTQDQADEIIADLPDRIEDLVNGTLPPRGPGRWSGPGGPGPHGDGPFGQAPATGTATS